MITLHKLRQPLRAIATILYLRAERRWRKRRRREYPDTVAAPTATIISHTRYLPPLIDARPPLHPTRPDPQ